MGCETCDALPTFTCSHVRLGCRRAVLFQQALRIPGMGSAWWQGAFLVKHARYLLASINPVCIQEIDGPLAGVLGTIWSLSGACT